MSDIDSAEVERLAASGDLKAQIYLGWAYDKFGPLEFDEAKSEYWLRQAVLTNDLEANRRLARFLSDRDKSETIERAVRLKNRGDFYGDYLLGHIYFFGRCGALVDKPKGLTCFSNAARAGHLISEHDFVIHSRSDMRSVPWAISVIEIKLKVLWFILTDVRSERLYK
jgi:TPR repeat protein